MSYSLWVKIIKFFAPYYEPKPKKKKKKSHKTKSKNTQNDTIKNSNQDNENLQKQNDNKSESESNINPAQEQEQEQNDNKSESNVVQKKEKEKENDELNINIQQVSDNNKDKDKDKDKYKDKDKDKNVNNIKKNNVRENKSKTKSRHSEFDQNIMDTLTNDNPLISLSNESMLMPVYNKYESLENAITFKEKPKINEIWAYHDKEKHQVFAHLKKGSGFICKTRNDQLRGNMTPWIRPMIKKKYDKTHLIPIGYHGSDGDQRLIIGWDSNHNQNELKNFEFKQKKRSEDIYWLTDVRHDKYGASWTYKIYSAKTLKQLDSITLRMNQTKFMWIK